MLRDLHPQSAEVTSGAVWAQGAQLFRRVQEEDGSKADSQFAHETFGLPKLYALQLGTVCALITSKGSFTLGHLQVVGCETRIANAKEIAL